MWILWIALVAFGAPNVEFDACYVGNGPNGIQSLRLAKDGMARLASADHCSDADGAKVLAWESYESGFSIKIDDHFGFYAGSTYPDMFFLTWAHDIDPDRGGRAMYVRKDPSSAPAPTLRYDAWYRSSGQLSDPTEPASEYFWAIRFSDDGTAALGRIVGGLEYERVQRDGFTAGDRIAQKCNWSQDKGTLIITCDPDSLTGRLVVDGVELAMPGVADGDVTFKAVTAP